ncbi:hypothetical protein GCM10010191_43110 [Actinomadura vinacea]|uniref:Phosphoenolpyruvate synthase n=1 Tax=Actinomadura vinacea TaxID=115336 RepID=A0ABN3JDB5_9ACTN
MTQRTFVLPLDDAGADPAAVGGRGAEVARLATAGLPVPEGFHVTTGAYDYFVDDHGLRGQILSMVSRVEPDLPVTAEAAAQRIAALFERHETPMEVAGPLRWAYAGMGEQDHPLAVRPSAPPGNLPDAPIAGRHDALLGVRGEAGLLTAVRRCWASLWSARAIEYRARNGVDHGAATIAVLVQSLVHADSAGLMSTVPPADEEGERGRAGRILLHATWGLGEPVVAGRVTPDAVVVEKGSGRVVGRRIADKTTMTVPSERPIGGGTLEEPVPDRFRREPVLNADQAAALARLGERIEALYGRPMDIEWVLYKGYPYIIQARPAANGGGARQPASGTEMWNDSLDADYLWSSANMGEAVPDVMTPCTWSLVQMFMHESMAVPAVRGHRAYGNIGGRLYMNLSVAATLTAFSPGAGTDVLEEAFGPLPRDVEIPRLPVSRAEAVRDLVPAMARTARRVRAARVRLPDFLASSPGRCAALRARIREETDPAALLRLWGHEVLPLFVDACHMLAAARREGGPSFVAMRRELERLAGEDDADAMLSGLGRPGGPVLDVLGPVTGLARLAEDELDEEAYLREWGHRGPHEFEISLPRPAEDPAWLEEQLAAGSGRAAAGRLRTRREASRAAWHRFRSRHPDKVAATRRRIGRWARAAHHREAAFSEAVRVYSVLREFVLRAGDLTGRRDDLFFLTIDEILAVLDGDARPLEQVSVRRGTYERYRALAPYPALIRGRFDPVAWAGGRVRRTDFHDAAEPLAEYPPEPSAGAAVTGFPGVAGVVEGTARVVRTPEEGGELATGEVLVAHVANVGWSPLFPRAAAVVTDVGAALSPAAIVARELAVPAVLGCGTATMRLRTGDRVRVDGERGTVEILSDAGGASPRERLLTREG